MKPSRSWGRLPADHLASTVHELRTPLTSILATLELLKLDSVSGNEAQELVEGATAAALHLDYLIGDILDEAALAAGELRLVQRLHRARDLFDELARILGLQAIARGVRLVLVEPDLDVRIHSDERRFLQIAINLVGNAIKFAPRGGRVQLSAEASGSCVRFYVDDDGPGVPKHTRDRLFEPFATIAPGSPVRGTGLGLALSQQLAKQLGGQIGFEPRSPRGSRFWFELPRAVAPAAGAT